MKNDTENYRTSGRRETRAVGGVYPPALALDIAGVPAGWLHWQDAVYHIAAGDVLWSLGAPTAVIHGGTTRCGERSRIELPPILALRGVRAGRLLGRVPTLTSAALFARDQMLCLYCGTRHPRSALTRDHVRPVSRGGLDVWENVVTACKRCNNRKADRTPDEAGMPLLAVPYAPNHAEGLILRNRRILADQMEFLLTRVPQARAVRYREWLALDVGANL